MKFYKRKKEEDKIAAEFTAEFINYCLLYKDGKEGIDSSQVKYMAKFLPNDVKRTIFRLIDEHGMKKAVEEFIPILEELYKDLK